MHTRTAALQAAATRLGSHEQLARHLRAPLHDVQRWMRGEAMPELCFLRAVDVMLADGEPLEKFRNASRGDAQLHFDMGTRRAYVHGQHVALPLTEWAVLESLAARTGQPVSLEQIRRELTLWTGRKLAHAIQMYVFRLRLKLAPLGLRIRTVPGTGYALEALAQ